MCSLLEKAAAVNISKSYFIWKWPNYSIEFQHLAHLAQPLEIQVAPIWRDYFRQIFLKNAAAAKSLQLCPTLCDPIDGSPPGSPIPGILQARTLEWVAISFSNAWKWKVRVKSLSHVWPLATPWSAAYQAPPSKGFSRQECWTGFPLPSPFLKKNYS